MDFEIFIKKNERIHKKMTQAELKHQFFQNGTAKVQNLSSYKQKMTSINYLAL